MRFGQFPVLIMLGKIQSSRLAGCHHRDGPLRIASLNPEEQNALARLPCQRFAGNPDPRPASAPRCWRQITKGRIPAKGGGITPRSAHFVNRFIPFSSWAWTQKLPGPASNGIVRSNSWPSAGNVSSRSSRLGTGLPGLSASVVIATLKFTTPR
jgi:hypothetical protein